MTKNATFLPMLFLLTFGTAQAEVNATLLAKLKEVGPYSHVKKEYFQRLERTGVLSETAKLYGEYLQVKLGAKFESREAYAKFLEDVSSLDARASDLSVKRNKAAMKIPTIFLTFREPICDLRPYIAEINETIIASGYLDDGFSTDDLKKWLAIDLGEDTRTVKVGLKVNEEPLIYGLELSSIFGAIESGVPSEYIKKRIFEGAHYGSQLTQAINLAVSKKPSKAQLDTYDSIVKDFMQAAKEVVDLAGRDGDPAYLFRYCMNFSGKNRNDWASLARLATDYLSTTQNLPSGETEITVKFDQLDQDWTEQEGWVVNHSAGTKVLERELRERLAQEFKDGARFEIAEKGSVNNSWFVPDWVDEGFEKSDLYLVRIYSPLWRDFRGCLNQIKEESERETCRMDQEEKKGSALRDNLLSVSVR